MNLFLKKLEQIKPNRRNAVFPLQLTDEWTVEVYPNSVNLIGAAGFFIGKSRGEKSLWVYFDDAQSPRQTDFEGRRIALPEGEERLLRCPLNHHNAVRIRALFDFARPTLLGVANSFGFGDRLGVANPAHARVAAESPLKAVFAQQSIRELQRTQRSPEEVMDAATWAVLQEGYKNGFGADADHLKTPADIDVMVKAGFTFFTIDPGEYVVNEADTLPLASVEKRLSSLSWEVLSDTPQNFLSRYENQKFVIDKEFTIHPTREQVLRGLLKYGGVIVHTCKMYRYLKTTYPDHPSEVELSVDETESVTSPFEHFLVANELKRLGVQLVSLAPRFVGDFEKGIDYKGDIRRFQQEFVKHIKIAEKLGPYKISLHSGSDKFRVYQAIGSLKMGRVHVKTAGTSYLEALRTVAATEPDLFREILDFSRGIYDEEKKTYHVSADPGKIKPSAEYADGELVGLLDQDNARQVLHVTFGKVLTATNERGAHLFKERILKCLKENEETHYAVLYRHFKRHLDPFA